MKIKRWEIALALALAVTFLCGFAVSREQTALADKLIRLHVVAASDSEEDQALKLQVRDAVLQQLHAILQGVDNREEAEARIRARLDELSRCAEETLQDAGKPAPVAVSLAVENFPTREYDTFSLPAGYYTSLRIVIGEGQGHNWWCVVFPPLCTEAATEDEFQDMGLTEEQQNLICGSGGGYVVRFRAMEWLSSLRSALFG